MVVLGTLLNVGCSDSPRDGGDEFERKAKRIGPASFFDSVVLGRVPQ